jgi:hypothetical protein
VTVEFEDVGEPLVESARVNGKPRIVSQRHLGSAEDITSALDGARAVPEQTRHLLSGDLAAVWWMLPWLGYAQIVDGGGSSTSSC